MKQMKKIAAVFAAVLILFSAVTPVFSVFAEGMGTEGSDSPEGDGGVYVSPRYLAGTKPSTLEGKTQLDVNLFLQALLQKAGKGYSQSNRYDVNYYDCSSLVQRVFRDFGITANVPASTYYWYDLLDKSSIGDTVTFYGADSYIEYRLTAKNITIQGHEGYFTKPGTIMVMIAPELFTGHICVSLGAFERQSAGLDPIADRNTIIQNTEDYVAAQMEARYGVPASLFTNPGAVSGVRSVWMYDNALGTDMTTKTGEQSGPYNSIWRVEAFNPSRGVCVDNCTHGTNYTPNVRYVLEPVSPGDPSVLDAAPEITDVTVSDVTPEGYRVNVKFTAPAGLREVQMPTWTENNWQDDLQWHNAIIVDGNTAYWDVKIYDHNNETGAYITHVYVTDILGRQAVAGVNVTVPESGSTEPEAPETMGFTEAWVSDVTEDGYVVNAEFIAPNGVSEILMPTWTEADGQDDLVWHKASTTDGKTVQYYVKASDHNNESGLYITHIYLRDPKGNEIVASVSADVPAREPEPQEELAITHVSVSDFPLGGGVRIGISYTAPKGVKEILMPTWTEKNGQDDLVWHKAEIHEEYNMASLDMNISDHNNELGVYYTHIYLYDNTGAYVIEPVTYTISKEYTPLTIKPVITDLVVSNVTEYGYTVTATISSINPIKEVLMPTWTEANGQDDLIWYEVHAYEKAVGVGIYEASYHVRTSDHNYERGQYITHVYVTDENGEQDVAATGAFIPLAQTGPKITDVTVTDVSPQGYTVTVTFDAPNGVKEVQMPTWTDKNWQDDVIWYNAEVNGNTASLRISTANHNNETGLYQTHIYVYDKADNYVIEKITVDVPEKEPVVQEKLAITDLEVTELSEDGFRVTAAFTAPNGVSEVLMPTWTEANGQDDLVWHRAQVNGNTATCYVRTADHKNESGLYITHVYVKDPSGKQVIAATAAEVPEKSTPAKPEGPVITNVTVSDVKPWGYSVTALLNVPNGVDKVLMPTWTDNNWQDDLVWYEVEVYGNIAYLYVNTENHNYETGLYHTHIYVYDKTGAYVIEPLDITVPANEDEPPAAQEELGIKYVMVVSPNIHGYTVFTEFTSPNGVSEVLMPTWTEANGQDDLIWHKAEIDSPNAPYKVNGHTATFYVQTAEHNNEHGRYITHVYLRDLTGKEVIAAIEVDVPEPSAPVDPEPLYPIYTQKGIFIYNGLDYAPVFHPDYYVNQYPDLKQAFGTNAQLAFQHFVNNGIQEGRTASPYFSVTTYRDRYADLRAAFGDNLPLYVQHYLTTGIHEGRSGK